MSEGANTNDLGWLAQAIQESGASQRALSAALGLPPTQLDAQLAAGTLRWDRVVALGAALGAAIPVRLQIAIGGGRAETHGWSRSGERYTASGPGWQAVAEMVGRKYQVTWYATGAGGRVSKWTSSTLRAALEECRTQAARRVELEGV